LTIVLAMMILILPSRLRVSQMKKQMFASLALSLVLPFVGVCFATGQALLLQETLPSAEEPAPSVETLPDANSLKLQMDVERAIQEQMEAEKALQPKIIEDPQVANWFDRNDSQVDESDRVMRAHWVFVDGTGECPVSSAHHWPRAICKISK
jgi:hypothetical protein